MSEMCMDRQYKGLQVEQVEAALRRDGLAEQLQRYRR